MNLSNHIQLFDDYLDGLMSSEEIVSFESRLKQESDFKSTFEKHKDLRNGIIWSGSQDLKAQIKEVEQAHFKMKVVKTPKKNTNNYIIGIAASLLLLIGAFFLIQRSGTETSAQDLYAAYYEPFNPNNGVRGNNLEQNIINFDKAYKAKNYSEALSLINVIQAEKESSDWNLYKAICLNEMGSMEEAESILLGLQQNGGAVLAHEAKWYLTMLYLKQGATDKASIYLKQLASDANGDHSEAAQNILKQID